MNIQIFGTKKCFDTKKAERFFKERGIRVQSVDIREKGLSKGELISVIQSLGGLDNVLNPNSTDQDTLKLVEYLTPDAKLDKVLENQHLLRTPIVRNGKKATVGYAPDVWKTWE